MRILMSLWQAILASAAVRGAVAGKTAFDRSLPGVARRQKGMLDTRPATRLANRKKSVLYMA